MGISAPHNLLGSRHHKLTLTTPTLTGILAQTIERRTSTHPLTMSTRRTWWTNSASPIMVLSMLGETPQSVLRLIQRVVLLERSQDNLARYYITVQFNRGIMGNVNTEER